jgi:hypothetical protein
MELSADDWTASIDIAGSALLTGRGTAVSLSILFE